MHLPDFALLVIGTLAAIAAGLAVLASNYRVARVLFWIAALSFGSLGVVWSGTSEGYSLSVQMAVSAIIGAIAAAGLTWALWEIRNKQNSEKPRDAVATAQPSSRGPTLEANTGGKIDATGAVIPGDLPFQFGKAESGGIIDMPGTIVTRKDDGSITITPSPVPVNRTFPAPTGEYSKLTIPELVEKLSITSNELRALDKEQSDQFDVVIQKYGRPTSSPPPEMKQDWNAVSKKFEPANEKYAALAQSLAAECMTRIPPINSSSMSQSVHIGALDVYHGRFAGSHPAFHAAAFLDFLSKQLEHLPKH